MNARTDRFTEGLEILSDLSRSDMDAINSYELRTRGLSGPNRAFGLHFGLGLRARKRAALKAAGEKA